LCFYEKEGRHSLPWRNTEDHYAIFLSEIMLQQTTVERVLPKYTLFLKTFPSFSSLKDSSFSSILFYWQGLGYNRRALFLYENAKKISSEYGECIPHDEDFLKNLKGVGIYTRRALLSFLYKEKVVCIETNIRTAVLHFFFEGREEKVSDEIISEILEKCLINISSPRIWYYALMDYGSFLKKQGSLAHRKSKEYKKQKKFIHSDRYIRGKILKILTEEENIKKGINKNILFKKIQKDECFDKKRILFNIENLKKEGFLCEKREIFSISEE
jgi:A/G-specific adenine glycosylase